MYGLVVFWANQIFEGRKEYRRERKEAAKGAKIISAYFAASLRSLRYSLRQSVS
jgi:hypothetical protein